VKEVIFDEGARREFLTGFHKRNVLKKEVAKKKAMDREKRERLETRREQRKMLAEQAVQNAREVEKAYGAQISDGDDVDWDRITNSPSGGKGKHRAAEHENEYEDEEQLATVTVVEDFDPEALLHGTSRHKSPMYDSGKEEDPSAANSGHSPAAYLSRKVSPEVKVKKVQAKTSTKAKTIKYQTNAARKVERSKQLRRKAEKAHRAGGKMSKKGSRQEKR